MFHTTQGPHQGAVTLSILYSWYKLSEFTSDTGASSPDLLYVIKEATAKESGSKIKSPAFTFGRTIESIGQVSIKKIAISNNVFFILELLPNYFGIYF